MGVATRFLYSQQEEYESPFYLKAQEQGVRYPKQGKPDDVSIIIAQVIKEELWTIFDKKLEFLFELLFSTFFLNYWLLKFY